MYAVSALWCRCRSTLPQGKHRVLCDWRRRYAKKEQQQLAHNALHATRISALLIFVGFKRTPAKYALEYGSQVRHFLYCLEWRTPAIRVTISSRALKVQKNQLVSVLIAQIRIYVVSNWSTSRLTYVGAVQEYTLTMRSWSFFCLRRS